MLRKYPQNTVVIPAKAKNPCWQASWLPGASRYVPSQWIPAFAGMTGK
jgi:hypothetical protein